jgi:hypothetical protein
LESLQKAQGKQTILKREFEIKEERRLSFYQFFLRNHPYRTQFTQLKCTVQWFLVNCATIAMDFRAFSLRQKRNPECITRFCNCG